MMLIFFAVCLFALFLLVIRPALLLVGGRIFKIEHVTFKKSLVVSVLIFLWGILVSIAVAIITTLFPGLIRFLIIFGRYDLLTIIASLIIAIWIIKKKFKSTRAQAAGTYIFCLVISLALALAMMSFVIQSFTIVTSNMKPAVLIGDNLLVNKLAYRFKEPKRGDVIAFKSPAEPEKIYLSRIIALPGETIRFHDTKVFIDERSMDEPYAYFEKARDTSKDDVYNFPPDTPELLNSRFPDRFKDSFIDTDNGKAFKVPEGHYFCMGDNRYMSYDCRFWGPVPAGNVAGKAWGIYWSRESSTGEYLSYLRPGLGRRVKELLSSVPDFFTKTRWKRIGQTVQ
jgi:signal peptidase I